MMNEPMNYKRSLKRGRRSCVTYVVMNDHDDQNDDVETDENYGLDDNFDDDGSMVVWYL